MQSFLLEDVRSPSIFPKPVIGAICFVSLLVKLPFFKSLESINYSLSIGPQTLHHLCLSPNCRPSTFAGWLKSTFAASYRQFQDSTPILGSCSAHEIRALATSHASWTSMSIKQVVSSCQWSTHNTFTNFYLDVQPDLQGIYSQGPKNSNSN